MGFFRTLGHRIARCYNPRGAWHVFNKQSVRSYIFLVLLLTLSGCGRVISLEAVDTLPKPVLYLTQNNGLCGFTRVVDGDRATWFEASCEKPDIRLKNISTLPTDTYSELNNLAASFPEPTSVPPNNCFTRRDMVFVSTSGTRSVWSICADTQTFEGSLFSAEKILLEIGN